MKSRLIFGLEKQILVDHSGFSLEQALTHAGFLTIVEMDTL